MSYLHGRSKAAPRMQRIQRDQDRTLQRVSILRRHLVQNATSNEKHSQEDERPARYYDWNEHQIRLPRLPLPSLNVTLQRYLESVRPIQSAKDHAVTTKAIEVFASPGGYGESLHCELAVRDRQSALAGESSSYVSPFWNKMYLQGRYELPINSNPVISMPHPFIHQADEPWTQAECAAELTAAFAQFWLAKREQRLPPDVKNGAAYCMDEYDRLFESARIPLSGCDTWRVGSGANHIVALRGKHVFSVDVIDSDGVVPIRILSKAFQQILSFVDEAGDNRDIGIAMMTAGNRDTWAKLRCTIIQDSPVNASSLDSVDASLFVVCLDIEAQHDNADVYLATALHGGHEHRWFDKTCLIVDPEGRSAVNFEHSLFDGAAVLRLISETWRRLNRINDSHSHQTWRNRWSTSSKYSRTKMEGLVRKLHFDIDSRSQSIMQSVYEKHCQNQSNLCVQHLSFRDYGKRLMKSSFGASPDGVIQACLKLTYHRVHGWSATSGDVLPCGVFVYESCGTKGFLCGRTETIRTTTIESNAWVDYMMKASNAKERISKYSAKLLRTCAAKHTALAKAASKGCGVDRHMFSLYCIHQNRNDKDMPSIFEDHAWAASNHSTLSTSNLSSESFSGVAFGPVVVDGYGIAYCLKNDELIFGISNLKDRGTLNSKIKVDSDNPDGARFGGVAGSSSLGKHSGGPKGRSAPTDSRIFKATLIDVLREVKMILEF